LVGVLHFWSSSGFLHDKYSSATPPEFRRSEELKVKQWNIIT